MSYRVGLWGLTAASSSPSEETSPSSFLFLSWLSWASFSLSPWYITKCQTRKVQTDKEDKSTGKKENYLLLISSFPPCLLPVFFLSAFGLCRRQRLFAALQTQRYQWIWCSASAELGWFDGCILSCLHIFSLVRPKHKIRFKLCNKRFIFKHCWFILYFFTCLQWGAPQEVLLHSLQVRLLHLRWEKSWI